MVQTGSDIPAKWQKPEADYDYVKREAMIPIRDGVKLHTVIVVPKGVHDLPMLLDRKIFAILKFCSMMRIDSAPEIVKATGRLMG